MKKKNFLSTLALLSILVLLSACSTLSKSTENKTSIYQYKGSEIIQQQNEMSKKMKQEFQKGNFTFDNPYIVKDPYNVSPLTAVIGFNTNKKGSVYVEVKGKDKSTTIIHQFNELKKSHLIPIYGLYPDFNNEVKIIFTNKDGESQEKTIYIKTDKLPDNMISINTVIADKKNMTNGLTMITSSHILAYDMNGDIRWYLRKAITATPVTPIKKLKNGHFIILSGKIFKPIYYTTGAFEFDLLGRIYKEYISVGAHHEILETNNGDLILSTSKNNLSAEDYFVRLDKKTGKIVDSWDIGSFFKVKKIADPTYIETNKQIAKAETKTDSSPEKNKAPKIDISKFDWFHNNAINYNEKDNTIIISGKNKDVIMKINASTREIIWILTNPNIEWAKAYKDKLLKPIGNNFEYTYCQHAVTLLPNGDIMVFDNGTYRAKEVSKMLSPNDDYSRAVIFHIDEKNKTVQQVWEYGKERGSELFSWFVGDVDYLGKNHYLIDFGGIWKDAQGNALYSNVGVKKTKAVIIEIKDNVVVNETTINPRYYNNSTSKSIYHVGNSDATVYRAERVSFYDNQSSYLNLSVKGKTLGKSNYKIIK